MSTLQLILVEDGPPTVPATTREDNAIFVFDSCVSCCESRVTADLNNGCGHDGADLVLPTQQPTVVVVPITAPQATPSPTMSIVPSAPTPSPSSIPPTISLVAGDLLMEGVGEEEDFGPWIHTGQVLTLNGLSVPGKCVLYQLNVRHCNLTGG